MILMSQFCLVNQNIEHYQYKQIPEANVSYEPFLFNSFWLKLQFPVALNVVHFKSYDFGCRICLKVHTVCNQNWLSFDLNEIKKLMTVTDIFTE